MTQKCGGRIGEMWRVKKGKGMKDRVADRGEGGGE